jgi:hypothetical protein
MSEQDQNQQNQTDGQGQSSAQAGSDSGATARQTNGGQASGQAAGQNVQTQTNQQSAQASGQQSAAGQSGNQSQGSAQASQQQTETPGIQAGGYKLSLTEAQRKRLLEDGVLDISEEQYTGGVRQQIETFKRRATTAERRLADIAAAQEDAERKALEEQERYKELYEKERQGRETESAARKDDAIRSRFLLTAQSKGIVDPDVAFVIAKSLPSFASVQFDSEGKVTGIDEVVETLVKEKPYLVSQQQQPKPQSVGAASNPAQQSPPPPKNLAEAGDRLEQALRTGVT